jgi:hypothetical protein
LAESEHSGVLRLVQTHSRALTDTLFTFPSGACQITDTFRELLIVRVVEARKNFAKKLSSRSSPLASR